MKCELSNEVTGTGNHVTGTGNHVTGTGSHVAGSGSHMTGTGSHVTGTGSHVTGTESPVTGTGSHVTGTGSHETGSHVTGTEIIFTFGVTWTCSPPPARWRKTKGTVWHAPTLATDTPSSDLTWPQKLVTGRASTSVRMGTCALKSTSPQPYWKSTRIGTSC